MTIVNVSFPTFSLQWGKGLRYIKLIAKNLEFGNVFYRSLNL